MLQHMPRVPPQSQTWPYIHTLRRRQAQPVLTALQALAGDVVRVLAVSGGSDSRALLEGWARHPHRHVDDVVVCVDHGVRAAAAAEANAVIARARVLGFQAEVRREHLSTSPTGEAELRALRRRLLVDAAQAAGATEVVFAHHGDDNVEGMWMHLMGDGGPKDGAALPDTASLAAGVVARRPFRRLRKADLEVALSAWRIDDVVVDEDDRALRNARSRTRQLLADVERQVPGLQRRLWQKSEQARLRVAAEPDVSFDDAIAQLRSGVRLSSLARQVLQCAAGAERDDPRDGQHEVQAVLRALDDTTPHPRRFRVGTLWVTVQQGVVRLDDDVAMPTT